MKTAQSETARGFLGAAAENLNIYGDEAKASMIAARVYELLAYRQGDIENVIAEIRAERAKVYDI